MDINKCYAILGLKPGAPLYYVRQAYKELAGMCEEDISGGDAVLKQRAEKRLRQIRAAYKAIVLSNSSTEQEMPDHQGGTPAQDGLPAKKPVPVQSPAPAKSKPKPPGRHVHRPEPESSGWPKLMIGITLVAMLAVGFIFARDITQSASKDLSELPELDVSLEVAESRESEKHRREIEKRRVRFEQTEIARIFDEKREAEERLRMEAELRALEKSRKKKRESEQRRKAETAKLRRELERIAKVQRQRVRGLLRKTGGRYVEKTDGVIMDRETGSMWCMRNSYLALGKCVNYEDAMRYVKRLRTGGYSDWRLPDVRELSEIYVRPPVFPSCGANWFWTSEVFTKGWKKVAYVVAPGQDEVKRQYLYLNRCGVAHAIRP